MRALQTLQKNLRIEKVWPCKVIHLAAFQVSLLRYAHMYQCNVTHSDCTAFLERQWQIWRIFVETCDNSSTLTWLIFVVLRIPAAFGPLRNAQSAAPHLKCIAYTFSLAPITRSVSQVFLHLHHGSLRDHRSPALAVHKIPRARKLWCVDITWPCKFLQAVQVWSECLSTLGDTCTVWQSTTGTHEYVHTLLFYEKDPLVETWLHLYCLWKMPRTSFCAVKTGSKTKRAGSDFLGLLTEMAPACSLWARAWFTLSQHWAVAKISRDSRAQSLTPFNCLSTQVCTAGSIFPWPLRMLSNWSRNFYSFSNER